MEEQCSRSACTAAAVTSGGCGRWRYGRRNWRVAVMKFERKDGGAAAADRESEKEYGQLVVLLLEEQQLWLNNGSWRNIGIEKWKKRGWKKSLQQELLLEPTTGSGCNGFSLGE
ncbi:hypothetical protein F0562_032808 [Nyssa sinensis]|uniref:Uncharacterized protein n=1 Tax=Nyssa sinensis TaxID=561372 RepID=A0A5J5ANS2_9ASTE|nr:hypothetical protein F0562_032808 [Nyssa sinensis]